MDLFASLKEKGIEALIQKSAPQLLEMLGHIHGDQASIAQSLGNIAGHLALIAQRQDMQSRALAQILTELRRRPDAAPAIIEQREALHGDQANGHEGNGIERPFPG